MVATVHDVVICTFNPIPLSHKGTFRRGFEIGRIDDNASLGTHPGNPWPFSEPANHSWEPSYDRSTFLLSPLIVSLILQFQQLEWCSGKQLVSCADETFLVRFDPSTRMITFAT